MDKGGVGGVWLDGIRQPGNKARMREVVPDKGIFILTVGEGAEAVYFKILAKETGIGNVR